MINELALGPGRFIPRHELSFRASRAGGPGGQHVNTSSTRVEVRWNISESGALSDEEKARIIKRLPTRVSMNGVIRVVASKSRSQHVNREAAEARLAELVQGALAVQRKRRATAPTNASVERRLREKKLRSTRKKQRSTPED